MSKLTKGVLKARPDDMVGPVLENTKNSHEAVFIFDEKDNFYGLISPQQAFLFERCPYFSHIRHCIYKPPHITVDTPLYDVAEFMLFSKIYTLPVFEDNKVKYIIKADNILKKLSDDKNLINKIKANLTINKPMTARDDVNIGKIFDILLKKNISRVILVDHEGDLTGIVSRRDLEDSLIVKTPRQRFGRREHNLKYTSFFDQEQVKRLDAPVSMFSTKRVVTTTRSSPLRWTLERMRVSGKNSVVIVDGQKPVGFLSRHDFLKALVSLRPIRDVQIIWEDAEGDVGEFTKIRMLNLLKKFARRYKGKSAISRIEIHVDEIQNTAGFYKISYIKLHVDFKSGRLAFANVETRDLVGGVREAIKRIERQFDFSDRQKHAL